MIMIPFRKGNSFTNDKPLKTIHRNKTIGTKSTVVIKTVIIINNIKLSQSIEYPYQNNKRILHLCDVPFSFPSSRLPISNRISSHSLKDDVDNSSHDLYESDAYDVQDLELIDDTPVIFIKQSSYRVVAMYNNFNSQLIPNLYDIQQPTTMFVSRC